MRLEFGRVSSVDAARHTAQVKLAEIDGMVTYDLALLAGRDGDYVIPSDNALVACLLSGGNGGIGVVLGVVYSDSDSPPVSDREVRVLRGDDIRAGSENASKAVALAPDVEDALTALKNAISGAVVVAQDGGASLKATILAALASWPPGVGASALKAE